MSASADSAKVVFYRGSQMYRAAMNFTIRANGEEQCRISNKRYFVYSCLPNTVKFTSVMGGLNIPDKEVLELTLEKGKVYYVQCDIKSSFITDRIEMTEVTESTAKKKMVNLKPDNCMTSRQ
ncbi:DUF2846 domain-containing protein [Siphonobacter sp. SORGH_AS_1065]|uniref:DUF2846 domain-containing protein n=1 Tax=Siphonobacter sp. SORGH_AS_1065 TaxID=3041795 RepID=UPI0027D804DE|nr:DUF2846 domain-containing protein [Siphonobacter sp. SORGH_AS_1065]